MIRTIAGLPLFIFLLCASLASVSQVNIEGVVLDQKTMLPVPFASIALENTNKGTVTGATGAFRYVADTSLSKFLRFSCVGYEMERIGVPLSGPITVCLKPVAIDLSEVVVLAGKRSWVADQVTAAVKKIRKEKQVRDARAFFSLETTVGENEPLEVLEGFYQCRISTATGISGLELKNGRFGISTLENFTFINSNPTNVIKNLPLFREKDFKLPGIPFTLGANEMRKKFRFRIDTLIAKPNSALAIISFAPKKETARFFSGSVCIDTTTHEIQKIILYCQHTAVHPFHPLDTAHRIGAVDLKLVVNFKNTGGRNQLIDYIRIGYSMEYFTKERSYMLKSSGLIIFYDYDNPFVLPFFIGAPGLSDYGKILSIPYNPLFWQRNYIIPVSQTMLDYTTYFKKNGVTVNYGETDPDASFLPRTVRYWYPGVHLSWDAIAKINPGWIAFAGSKRKRMDREDFLSRKYFMDFQIFFDLNPDPDTCYQLTRSVLFLDNSFYEPERDSLAIKAFELEFDMAELYRLRFVHKLDSAVRYGCQREPLTMLYDQSVKQFEKMRALYKKEVRRGQNRLAYDTWRKRIDLRLSREKKIVAKAL